MAWVIGYRVAWVIGYGTVVWVVHELTPRNYSEKVKKKIKKNQRTVTMGGGGEKLKM